jgi:hypothetical protein
MSDAPAAELCLLNIGPAQRLKRLRFGLVAFGVAIALGLALTAAGAGRPARVVLWLPLAAAMTGVFQGWRKT